IGFVALGIWSANRLIAGLARLYERGWISDISLVVLFGIGLTDALACVWADREDVAFTRMVAAFLIWVALTIGAYIVALRRTPSARGRAARARASAFSPRTAA